MAKKLTIKEPDVTYVVTPTTTQTPPVFPMLPKPAPAGKAQKAATFPRLVEPPPFEENEFFGKWPDMRPILLRSMEVLGVDPATFKPATVEEVREMFARAQAAHPECTQTVTELVVEMREE